MVTNKPIHETAASDPAAVRNENSHPAVSPPDIF
jgi:hypothetical protein